MGKTMNHLLMRDVCKALDVNAIESLDLSNQELDDEGMVLLSRSFKRNSSLISLNLSNTSLGPGGISILCQSLSSLHTLILANNRIGNEGLRILCDSSLIRGIKILDLSNNSISSSSASRLAKADVTTSQLEQLSLQNNFIGADGIKHIAASFSSDTAESALLSLHLQGNPGGHLASKHIVKMMRNNTRLLNVTIDCDSSNRNLIRYYLELNRYGRVCLRSYNLEPPLWPKILAKTGRQPDLLHTIICGRPEVFCTTYGWAGCAYAHLLLSTILS